MENIIEHEGKKYREVPERPDGTGEYGCHFCCWGNKDRISCDSPFSPVWDCVAKLCHFELVEETNQKE